MEINSLKATKVEGNREANVQLLHLPAFGLLFSAIPGIVTLCPFSFSEIPFSIRVANIDLERRF